MFCYPIIATSLYFPFLTMKRVGIDSWTNRAFCIEIYTTVVSKCLKELKITKYDRKHLSTIKVFSVLWWDDELFSVLSWQVFEGHFQIIIFSQFFMWSHLLLLWSCSLETEVSVIDCISAVIISGTICVLVLKSKLVR